MTKQHATIVVYTERSVSNCEPPLSCRWLLNCFMQDNYEASENVKLAKHQQLPAKQFFVVYFYPPICGRLFAGYTRTSLGSDLLRSYCYGRRGAFLPQVQHQEGNYRRVSFLPCAPAHWPLHWIGRTLNVGPKNKDFTNNPRISRTNNPRIILGKQSNFL